MTLENAIEMDDILTTSQNYNRIREPIAKSPLRTPNKAPLNEDRDSTAIKGSPNTRFHGTNFDKITITNIEVGEDDQESLGRRKVAVYNEDFCKVEYYRNSLTFQIRSRIKGSRSETFLKDLRKNASTGTKWSSTKKPSIS
jgi:hypothetical protein